MKDLVFLGGKKIKWPFQAKLLLTTMGHVPAEPGGDAGGVGAHQGQNSSLTRALTATQE